MLISSMELYANTIGTALHTVYVGDDLVDPVFGVAFSVTDPRRPDADNIVDFGDATAVSTGVYKAVFSTDVTSDLYPKMLSWSYTVSGQDFRSTEPVRIVVPYISLQEYNSRYPHRKLEMAEFRNIERNVRRVIDAYCRQSFQFRPGETMVTPGGSTNTLQLPDRLVRMDKVTSGGTPITSTVGYDTDDPWSLHTSLGPGYLSPRVSDPLERTTRFDNKRYAVTGDWGWRYVPDEVRDAAGILINDFLDDDAVYREKYVDNIRAADWRMEFAATGNETTGNANADMMIERYRNYRPGVV